MGTLRTILRRAFYTAAALSTLLLLATLILWPLSYYRSVDAGVRLCERTIRLDEDWGRAHVKFTRNDSGPIRLIFRWRSTRFAHRPYAVSSFWNYFQWREPVSTGEGTYDASSSLGLRWEREDASESSLIADLYIPFSYLALLFSSLPLLAFRSIRRRRKAARAARIGLCAKCGYDLRAQLAGAGGTVCPECGTPLAARP